MKTRSRSSLETANTSMETHGKRFPNLVAWVERAWARDYSTDSVGKRAPSVGEVKNHVMAGEQLGCKRARHCGA